MRKLLSLFLLLLLVGTGLAGCLSSAEDPDLDDAGGNETGGDQDDWDQMPANRSGEFSAFRETNKTEDGSGGMAHDHDYWQGRSRVTLFQTTAEMPPSTNPSGATVVFRPPPPALVYEGTGHVEITISNPQRHGCVPGLRMSGDYICSSNKHVGALPQDQYAPEPRSLPAMQVEFLHGASNPDEWISAGQIEWDTPFQISVDDPVWTDMPHATATLWAFKFTSTQALDSTLVFDVTMDIVRSDADEIPVWPGHPDFYADADHRLVYDGPGAFQDPGTVPDPTGAASGGGEMVRPERLISYGTNTLHVWVNITDVQAPPSLEPTHWYLRLHNASWQHWQITDPFDDAYTGDLRELYFVIDVDANGMDTPYASASRWEFELRGSHTTPAMAFTYGWVNYRVAYNMAIVATTEELVEDAYNPLRKA